MIGGGSGGWPSVGKEIRGHGDAVGDGSRGTSGKARTTGSSTLMGSVDGGEM